ncbi:hypothetical protein GJ631_07925 [Natronomonas sp. CBA1123]|uniref:hypothetical protein n=1 Tax=Natronomonas sp. CBA1123 TaxID=2668070 RepID=UPI0012EA65F0|nr:hypothetical protein [Natronomonas sp. CBA1123]MUV86497.1 hypothetical protein [Natronomonas sp. CBA1123]
MLVAFVGGWFGDILGELALWSGVLLVFASVLALYSAWKRREIATLVDETPRVDIGDIESPGLVRVRGTVAPSAEGTFISPIAGDRECVLSAWEIEEQYDTPKTNSWESAAWGVRSERFHIEDATGTLSVAINDRTVGNETGDVFTPEKLLVSDGVAVDGLQCAFGTFETEVETDYEESPPKRIRDFLAATPGVSVDPMATDLVVDASKRRYSEATLQPGDSVSLLGHVSRQDDSVAPQGESERFVITPSEESTLYLSTEPFDDVPDGSGAVLFGVLVGAVGIGLLIVAFLM